MGLSKNVSIYISLMGKLQVWNNLALCSTLRKRGQIRHRGLLISDTGFKATGELITVKKKISEVQCISKIIYLTTCMACS